MQPCLVFLASSDSQDASLHLKISFAFKIESFSLINALILSLSFSLFLFLKTKVSIFSLRFEFSVFSESNFVVNPKFSVYNN